MILYHYYRGELNFFRHIKQNCTLCTFYCDYTFYNDTPRTSRQLSCQRTIRRFVTMAPPVN